MHKSTQAELIRQGATLFNRGEYYACHEVFEEAWMEAQGSERLFLQGVIQLAVALHHLSNGNANGARRLLAESAAKLREHAPAQGWIEAEPLALAAESIRQRLATGTAMTLDPGPQILFRPVSR